MLKRYLSNPILGVNPSNAWESGSVFNPCVIAEKGKYHMLYRATNDTKKLANKFGHYVSSIGYARSNDGIHFRRRKYPLISPTETYEDGLGCEDARLSRIDDTYYIYYTSVEGVGDSKQVRIAWLHLMI